MPCQRKQKLQNDNMDAENNFSSRLAWILPFFVSGGMGLGAFLGLSFFGDMMHREGPEGDLAGAAGALLILICVSMGFLLALTTVVIAKVRGRKGWDRFLLRFCLSMTGGLVEGIIGINGGGLSTALAWLLLLSLPVVVSWPWQREGSAVKTPHL